MDIGNDDAELLRKLEFDAGMKNNLILSDSERQQTRGLINEAEGLLASLDREIDLLTARRAMVAERLWKYCVATAPHKRLPPEILAAIFVYTLDSRPLEFPPISSQSPWVLRQVCSTWRSVALNESRLWNSIEVNMPIGVDSELLAALTKLIRSTLPPAGPISISMSVPDYIYISTHLINHVVMPNLQRIKALKLGISLPAFAGLLELLRTPNEQSRSLESLSLDLQKPRGYVVGGESSMIMDKFRQAVALQQTSRLKRLELSSKSGALPCELFLLLPLPFNRLTSLCLTRLHSLTIPSLHGILRRCPSLVELTMVVDDLSSWRVPGTTDASESLELRHLRHVRLTGLLPSRLSPSDLRLPWNQLYSLDMCPMGAESLASVHGILHHCTQLQELSISNQVDYVADPEVRSELITLERLHYLKVEIDDLWGTAVLDTFVLPALRTLSITGGRRLPFSTILTLLHRSGCMLTRFVYDGDHLLDDYVTRQLIAHMPSLTYFHAPRLGPDDERKLIFEDVKCDRWWEGTGGQSARRGDWSEGDEQEVDEDEDETDEEDEERRGE